MWALPSVWRLIWSNALVRCIILQGAAFSHDLRLTALQNHPTAKLKDLYLLSSCTTFYESLDHEEASLPARHPKYQRALEVEEHYKQTLVIDSARLGQWL